MESMSTLQSEFSMGFDTLFVVLMLINIKDANYFFWTSSFQECFWGDTQPRQNIVIRVHAHLGWVLCFIFEGDPPNRIPSSRKMCCWSLHVYATEFKPTFISWNFALKIPENLFAPRVLFDLKKDKMFGPETNIHWTNFRILPDVVLPDVVREWQVQKLRETVFCVILFTTVTYFFPTFLWWVPAFNILTGLSAWWDVGVWKMSFCSRCVPNRKSGFICDFSFSTQPLIP